MSPSSTPGFAAFFPLTRKVLTSTSHIFPVSNRNRLVFSIPFSRPTCTVPLCCTSSTSGENPTTLSSSSSSLSSSSSSTTTSPPVSIDEYEDENESELKNENVLDIESMSSIDRERIDTIRDLLEFWFSAINLRRDWYLRRQMDENGWLNPAIFLLFNRVKSIKASIEDIIMAAKLSDELEIKTPNKSTSFGEGDDLQQTRIRRSQSLPDFKEWDDEELKSSFLLKSIPYNSSVESIKEIFEPYGKITYIRIYRNHSIESNNIAKRAMVCFENEQVADEIYNNFATNAPDVACGIILRRRHIQPGNPAYEIIASNKANTQVNGKFSLPLVVTKISNLPDGIDWKTLYQSLDESIYLRSNRRLRYLLHEYGSSDCHVTITDAPSVRDMIKLFEEKGLVISGHQTTVQLLKDQNDLDNYWAYAKKHLEDRQKKRSQRPNGNNQLNGSNYNINNNKRPSGVVVKVNGLSKDLTWRMITAQLSTLGQIVFLNYTKGNDHCYVRVSSKEDATKFCEGLSGDELLSIFGEQLNGYVIDGNEEEEYWNSVEERRKNRRVKLEDVDADGSK